MFAQKEKSLNLLSSIQHRLPQALTNIDLEIVKHCTGKRDANCRGPYTVLTGSQTSFGIPRVQSPNNSKQLTLCQVLHRELSHQLLQGLYNIDICSQCLFSCQGLQLPEALNKLDFKLKNCMGIFDANCRKAYTILSLTLLYEKQVRLSTLLLKTLTG